MSAARETPADAPPARRDWQAPIVALVGELQAQRQQTRKETAECYRQLVTLGRQTGQPRKVFRALLRQAKLKSSHVRKITSLLDAEPAVTAADLPRPEKRRKARRNESREPEARLNKACDALLKFKHWKTATALDCGIFTLKFTPPVAELAVAEVPPGNQPLPPRVNGCPKVVRLKLAPDLREKLAMHARRSGLDCAQTASELLLRNLAAVQARLASI
jgi:hypothetical protein